MAVKEWGKLLKKYNTNLEIWKLCCKGTTTKINNVMETTGPLSQNVIFWIEQKQYLNMTTRENKHYRFAFSTYPQIHSQLRLYWLFLVTLLPYFHNFIVYLNQ